MNKLKQIAYYLLITGFIFLTACGDDDTVTPKGAYETGIYVVNEGNFGEGDGSISFLHEDGTTENGVFSTVNDSRPLGDVVQSMHLSGDNGYIVVNNSNVVEVVDRYTMESLASLEAALPRYMTSEGSTGYLTEWVSFSDPGQVSIINLETNTVSNTIEVGFGAENLLVRNGKLYVSNNFSSSVSVIDLASETVVSTLTTGSSPAGMILDSNNDIWVVCAGGFNEDWSPANNGQLLRINENDEIDFTKELEMNVSGKIAASGNSLYFFAGTSIYSFNTSSPSDAASTFVENTTAVGFYGIGVDNDMIYVADASGFQANGKVYVYDASGSLNEEFSVGRGTNGFAFQ